MGVIIYYAILRSGLTILFLWLTIDYWGEKYFPLIGFLFFILFVIYPTIKAYRIFIENNQKLLANSLCSKCRHFAPSAILCIKYDKHPTLDFIPCNAEDWEPINN